MLGQGHPVWLRYILSPGPVEEVAFLAFTEAHTHTLAWGRSLCLPRKHWPCCLCCTDFSLGFLQKPPEYPEAILCSMKPQEGRLGNLNSVMSYPWSSCHLPQSDWFLSPKFFPGMT